MLVAESSNLIQVKVLISNSFIHLELLENEEGNLFLASTANKPKGIVYYAITPSLFCAFAENSITLQTLFNESPSLFVQISSKDKTALYSRNDINVILASGEKTVKHLANNWVHKNMAMIEFQTTYKMITEKFQKNMSMRETEEIRLVYDDWKNALINADLALLATISADNFEWINDIGITNNKRQSLDKIASGNLRYLSWVNEDLTIKIIGDIGILKTTEILKLIVYNQRVNIVQDVTAIFIKQDGKWLLAGGQETNSKF
jgi:hypothetical protein